MQLFAQGRKVNHRLTALFIRRAPAPPDLVAKELPFGHRHLGFVDAEGEPEQDRLVQERLQAHQVVDQVGVGLRMPTPHVLRQTVVVVICRGLLHHLLDVPALHYVVAGAGGGIRRARVTSRSRTLQPASRRALDPACPLRGAARPKDREPLRNRNVPTERHARAATKVRVSHRRQASPVRCSRQVSKGWSLP